MNFSPNIFFHSVLLGILNSFFLINNFFLSIVITNLINKDCNLQFSPSILMTLFFNTSCRYKRDEWQDKDLKPISRCSNTSKLKNIKRIHYLSALILKLTITTFCFIFAILFLYIVCGEKIRILIHEYRGNFSIH